MHPSMKVLPADCAVECLVLLDDSGHEPPKSQPFASLGEPETGDSKVSTFQWLSWPVTANPSQHIHNLMTNEHGLQIIN